MKNLSDANDLLNASGVVATGSTPNEPNRLVRSIFHGKQRQVQFYLNEKPIEHPFLIGNSKIEIFDKLETSCIRVTFDDVTNILNLENYYYNGNKDVCPQIDHNDFFAILDFIAAALGATSIQLNDQSHKNLNGCTIPKNVLALAKSKTFYNRFHFVNSNYENQLLSTQPKLAKDINLKNSAWELLKTFTNVDELATVQQISGVLIEQCPILHDATDPAKNPNVTQKESDALYDKLEAVTSLIEFFDTLISQPGDNDHLFTKPVTGQSEIKITQSSQPDGLFSHVDQGTAENSIQGNLRFYLLSKMSGGKRTKRKQQSTKFRSKKYRFIK